jgi:hypothetical protein
VYADQQQREAQQILSRYLALFLCCVGHVPIEDKVAGAADLLGIIHAPSVAQAARTPKAGSLATPSNIPVYLCSSARNIMLT